jgi:hypothetical protein
VQDHRQFGDCLPCRAHAARRAGDQNGICHVSFTSQTVLSTISDP